MGSASTKMNTNKSYNNMNGISASGGTGNGTNSSMIGMGTNHMNKTSTMGNMSNPISSFKNGSQTTNGFANKTTGGPKDENIPSIVNNRSYSVNRALKDITNTYNNVLNSSGAAVI